MSPMSDLGFLDLTLPANLNKGRPAKSCSMEVLRELEPSDIALILNAELGAKVKPLQKIRAAHHALAVLLAQGKSDVDCASITGRSVTNILTLKRDPAFKQLLSHYRQMGEQELTDVYAQAGNLSSAALAELAERIENEPEKFTNKELLDLAEKTMDRTGLGPSKTIKTLNSTDVVKELVKQRQAERAGRIIDPEAA